jgi:hypothetical protein
VHTQPHKSIDRQTEGVNGNRGRREKEGGERETRRERKREERERDTR